MVALRRDQKLTLTQIGERFNISRERVRQLISPYVDTSRPERFTPEQRIRMASLATKYGSTRTARRTGVSAGTLGRWGAAPGRGRRNAVRNAEWIRLYVEEEWSTVDIGRAYGVQPQYVYETLKRRIAMRSRAEAARVAVKKGKYSSRDALHLTGK